MHEADKEFKVIKADKEFVLNYSMNRWGLNKKANVGPTSESIRKCAPESLQQWQEYYFRNVRSRQQIVALGKKLYRAIKNAIVYEERFYPKLVDSITEEDCIKYMLDLVLKRTYDGYRKEFG